MCTRVLVVDENVRIDDSNRHSATPRERGVLLVIGDIVRFETSTAHRGLHIIGRAAPLLDECNGELLVFGDMPAEPVANFDVESPPECRRERNHLAVTDRHLFRDDLVTILNYLY